MSFKYPTFNKYNYKYVNNDGGGIVIEQALRLHATIDRLRIVVNSANWVVQFVAKFKLNLKVADQKSSQSIR